MWNCIVGRVVPGVSQDRRASFYGAKQSKNNKMLHTILFVSSLHLEFKADQMLVPLNLKYASLIYLFTYLFIKRDKSGKYSRKLASQTRAEPRSTQMCRRGKRLCF
jgi:hypothetical protein